MANRKLLQLLLVEANPEDEQLICEALIEIDERRLWRNWHACELVQVDTLEDAVDCLRKSAYDVVLLDLNLPGASSLLEMFQEIQGAAGGTAVVAMAEEEEDDLASRLLHEGAQEVVLKSEIECEPLARAIRHAVERQRRSRAVESVGIFDDLSGLYNTRGFAVVAQHDFEIAVRTGYPFTLAVIEVAGLPKHLTSVHRDDRDLLVIRAGELLRTLFGASALVARIGEYRFGILTIAVSEGGAERLAGRFEAELCSMWNHNARFPLEVRTGVATLFPDGRAGLEDLLEEAQQRLSPKTVMLAN